GSRRRAGVRRSRPWKPAATRSGSPGAGSSTEPSARRPSPGTIVGMTGPGGLTDATARSLLDAAPDAIVVTRDGRIEFVNAATERPCGYAPAELLGELVERLLPP